jgi:hypothetical protein
LDICLPVTLLLALAVVFAVDRLKPQAADQGGQDGEVKVTEETGGIPPPPPRNLRLGVTPAPPHETYDDMGRLLDDLGEGYKYTAFPMDDLQDAKKLAEFDVIFLTCSGVTSSWLDMEHPIGEGPRPGTKSYPVNQKVYKQVQDNLREFVARGGTLYVSDWHYKLISGAFPEFADRRTVHEGRKQELTAEVVEAGLRELIGSKLKLNFDQEAWFPAAFRGDKLTVYMKGAYQTKEGGEQTGALLVRFPYKDGTVIFTSFHNEKNNSEAEKKLLRYLVFTTITSGETERIQKTMVQGGFRPGGGGLFSAAKENPSVTQTYRCTEEGPLKFVLGFQGEGARLKLTVRSPDGKKYEKEGTSTLTIDVPAAVVGDWKYTITALELPNENFPFTVTVGQKKK